MTSMYDVAPLHVWRDEEAQSLLFEWFGIAPASDKLRKLFGECLTMWRAEQRARASARPLGCLVDLRQLLIPNVADLRWLADSWGPELVRAGAQRPLFVLSDAQLACVAPWTPCVHLLPADDETLTAPALFADRHRAQWRLRRRARRVA